MRNLRAGGALLAATWRGGALVVTTGWFTLTN
jgi:hypothetical protein